ncbi:hypothetical protein PYW08_012514 [Mythimna loreyi]|uniref:Uncharacterized protein n=1 Tax=Mythimna loreyi TaxID=667449 RepID=A0ACC2Q0D8_9NEOP|nr:hypothetical protein PYW08_012514 [Mythimna loreyi]
MVFEVPPVHRSVSPLSDMSEGTLERNRAEKALIVIKRPPNSLKNSGAKNYCDKNGNDVNKKCDVQCQYTGTRCFAFWAFVFMVVVFGFANLVLSAFMMFVLKLGKGMESMEFLPDHNAIKFFGETDFEHLYKKDGLIESFRDTPMSISSENGSVLFNLQTKPTRHENKLTVNTSGVFVRGVNALELTDPESGEVVFSTAATDMNIPDGVNNLHAKQISVKRITSPVDEDLTLRSETSAYLRGAEGTHMESKALFWSADQDIYLKSINGSIILSGKDGVFIDVRYLPIASTINKTDKYGQGTGQFKVCVCMPQGKLFRIAVPTGQKVTCSHINMTGDLNPCN